MAALVLTACPKPEPQVIEKVIKETVEVVVEKPIEVEKIVQIATEVQVEVETFSTPSGLAQLPDFQEDRVDTEGFLPSDRR